MPKLFAAVLLLASITAWSGAATAAPLHDFVDSPSRTKAELLKRMAGPDFRPSHKATVDLFNRKVGTRIGFTADSFESLMDFLGSLEVTVGPCNWSKDDAVSVFGLTSKARFGSIHRGCYGRGTPEAELALYYHGIALFSLKCGNLIADARERKHAELAPPPPAPELPRRARRGSFDLEAIPNGVTVDP